MNQGLTLGAPGLNFYTILNDSTFGHVAACLLPFCSSAGLLTFASASTFPPDSTPLYLWYLKLRQASTGGSKSDFLENKKHKGKSREKLNTVNVFPKGNNNNDDDDNDVLIVLITTTIVMVMMMITTTTIIIITINKNKNNYYKSKTSANHNGNKLTWTT